MSIIPISAKIALPANPIPQNKALLILKISIISSLVFASTALVISSITIMPAVLLSLSFAAAGVAFVALAALLNKCENKSSHLKGEVEADLSIVPPSQNTGIPEQSPSGANSVSPSNTLDFNSGETPENAAPLDPPMSESEEPRTPVYEEKIVDKTKEEHLFKMIFSAQNLESTMIDLENMIGDPNYNLLIEQNRDILNQLIGLWEQGFNWKEAENDCASAVLAKVSSQMYRVFMKFPYTLYSRELMERFMATIDKYDFHTYFKRKIFDGMGLGSMQIEKLTHTPTKFADFTIHWTLSFAEGKKLTVPMPILRTLGGFFDEQVKNMSETEAPTLQLDDLKIEDFQRLLAFFSEKESLSRWDSETWGIYSYLGNRFKVEEMLLILPDHPRYVDFDEALALNKKYQFPILDFGILSLGDEHLEKLTELDHVRTLVLRNGNFTPCGLEKLPEKLEKLQLSFGKPITMESIEPLPESIKILQLLLCTLTEKAMAQIAARNIKLIRPEGIACGLGSV